MHRQRIARTVLLPLTRWRKDDLMVHFRHFVAVLGIAGLLAACGDPTKGEILKKAEGADTKALLEKALGQPKDVSKVGPLESWTYAAADGSVTFVIAGDRVTMSATSDSKVSAESATP